MVAPFRVKLGSNADGGSRYASKVAIIQGGQQIKRLRANASDHGSRNENNLQEPSRIFLRTPASDLVRKG
jgi:hypothetical protein